MYFATIAIGHSPSTHTCTKRKTFEDCYISSLFWMMLFIRTLFQVHAKSDTKTESGETASCVCTSVFASERGRSRQNQADADKRWGIDDRGSCSAVETNREIDTNPVYPCSPADTVISMELVLRTMSDSPTETFVPTFLLTLKLHKLPWYPFRCSSFV